MPASERFSPYNLPYPPWARVLLVGIGKKLRLVCDLLHDVPKR